MPVPKSFETSHDGDHPLIRLSLVAPFLDRLTALGISVEKPLNRLGLTHEMVANPDVFVHAEVLYGLMNEMARAANDPFLGLHVGEEMDLSGWPALSVSLGKSRTVGEFLERFVQNVPHHATSVMHMLTIDAERAQYRVNRVRQSINSAAQSDGLGAGIYLRVLEAVASKLWTADEVILRTAYPEAIPSGYRGTTVKTHPDAAFAIEFPTEILFSDIVFDATKTAPASALASRPSIVSALRVVASRLLGQKGDLHQSVADALGVSIQRLEKTLVREGTSLSQEIKTLKCENACDLLKDTNVSIADIGARIGYCEPANFTRFFKSQLAMTPKQYRRSVESRK